MTNKKIVQKAIEKAIKNGYQDKDMLLYQIKKHKESGYIENNIWDNGEWYGDNVTIGIYNIIFSHAFAKALWGEEEVDCYGRTLNISWEEEWKTSGHYVDKEEFENDFGFDIETEQAWRYHLKILVLCVKPLKYLKEFIDAA